MSRRKIVNLESPKFDNVNKTPVVRPLKSKMEPVTDISGHVNEQPKKKRMKMGPALPLRSTFGLARFAPPAPTFYTRSYLFPEETASSAMDTSTTETEPADGTASPLTKKYDALMNWLKNGSIEDPVPLPPSSTGDAAVCPSLSDVYELLDLDTKQKIPYARTARPLPAPYVYHSPYNYHYHRYYQQMFPLRGYGPRYM